MWYVGIDNVPPTWEYVDGRLNTRGSQPPWWCDTGHRTHPVWRNFMQSRDSSVCVGPVKQQGEEVQQQQQHVVVHHQPH